MAREGAARSDRNTVRRGRAAVRNRARWLLLLWAIVVADFVWMAHRYLSLDAHIRWRGEVQAEVGESMAGYDLRDSAAWAATSREDEREIARLRTWRRVTGWTLVGLVAVGGIGTVLILRRTRDAGARGGDGR